ncbi:alpha-amylase [Aquimarina aggregata]|uniref:Alpha-amylase n=1 Tax=Aquimarina aggregata TaxID=1642818 RepID=A0A163BTF5_9FLAO|nr:alpha-amylase [Aquimarina aggregata]KZS41741.1 alpha-amylase [Aquimarina aggregata]
MKKIINISTKTILLLGGLVFGLTGCSDDDDSANTTETIVTSQSLKMDLNQFKREDAGIFMQAFYWDVEPRGAWYDEVSKSIEDWAASGIDRIWLAPPGKAQSGGFSMGYDPCDYFDLGEFDQHGTVETRFGSRQELENLIQKSHDNGLEVIADIVLNHNSGGQLEANPNTGTDTFTKFDPASGLFPRTYDDFYPDETGATDESVFGGFPDLNHTKENVQNWLWKNENSVAKFYKSIGFDGWRFDFVKGFAPKWVTAWNEEVGGYSVGENFDGNEQVLKDWVDASGSPAFDFACFYRLDETLDRNKDLTALGDAGNMLRKLDPAMAVTFTANHDTEKDENPNNRISYGNKLLAYSYILTHDGYPTIFYLDYEAFKGQLKTLMEINSTLAVGDIEILEASKDEYIMKRGGNGTNPGLILYMNISKQPKERVVKTNWINKKLVDYTDNTRLTPTTDAEGNTTIYAPAGGYAIWSITK